MGAPMLVALACLALPVAHENSHSFSRVVVDGTRLELELRCQTRSVIEALGLDDDRDGELSDDELSVGRERLADYLSERFELRSGTGADAGAVLPATLASVELLRRGEGRFAEQWVGLHFELEAPSALSALQLEVSLFREQNPFHRDSCALEWNGAERATWLFGIDGAVWEFEPAARRRPSVFGSHVVLGLEHLLGGWDHIAFVLALLVAARSVRGLLWTVTAFTLAHSLTLGLAALELVDVPARLVELAIAMSVVYVGAEGLLLRRAGNRALEAFCFGLIHGLGFASFLGASLFEESLKLTALVGFNLGVELGQLAIVLTAVVVLRVLPGERGGASHPASQLVSHSGAQPGAQPETWLAPRWLRLALSALVTILGSVWFCQRAGWLG